MSSLQTSRNNQKGKNKRRGKNPAALGQQGAPIRVVLDGPESNQLVRDPVFPLASTLGNKVYNIVAAVESSAFLTSSTTLPTFANQVVNLSFFDKVSSYTNIFDQYRIVMLELTLLPGSGTVVSGGNSGMLSTVIDYDDGTNLTTVAQALDYATCLTTDGVTRHKRTYHPHTAEAAYSGAFTSFANRSNSWIDCASNSVQYYGLKTAWSATTSIYVYDIIVRAWIQFRNTR